MLRLRDLVRRIACHNRRQVRAMLQAPLEVDCQGNVLSGWSVDIAEGGMGAVLPQALKKGTSVLLAFQLPSTTRTLAVRATVRYAIELHGDYRHGFAFGDLLPADRECIRTYLEVRAAGAQWRAASLHP